MAQSKVRVFYFRREHHNSMTKLRKLLSDDSKNRRSRRNILSIQITILGWVVELVGFLTIAVGTYVLGNKNKLVTMALQSASILIYVILIPCSILINSSEVKEKVAESHVYLTLTTVLGCKPTTYEDDERSKDDEDEHNDKEEDDDDYDHAEADGRV